MTERKVDVAIIGAGTAGLFALGRVRKAGVSFVLINGGELGTTCARVGCMPSKVLIQEAEDYSRRHYFKRIGIHGGEDLHLNTSKSMEHVRDLRDIFVDKVLTGSTDSLGDEFIEGYAKFIEPTVLQVDQTIIRARRVVIATGSRPFIPAAWEPFKDRILTSDNLFEQDTLPKSIAAIGLGVIGLEMGQALHRLGVAVTGMDQLNTIAGLTDPVVNKEAIAIIGKEFPLWLGAPADVEPHQDGVQIRCADQNIRVEKILASMGRVPNLEGLGIERLGVKLNVRGVPEFNPYTMQVGNLPVFIAGDVTGDRAILHEAGHEGQVAGVNAAQPTVTAFARKTPMAITFCDPNIAAVGAGWDEIDQDAVVTGEIRFGPVGRALVMGKNKGVLRVYGDSRTGRILGGSMVAPQGEHLAHLLVWAVQRNLTVFDVLAMPFYHPTIEEALQAALRNVAKQVSVRPSEPYDLRPANDQREMPNN